MTIVIGFAINQYPVLMADILLSAQGYSHGSLELPSVRKIMLPNDLEYYPLGMMQKLAILSDDFAIGWAGNAKTAQREIQELDRINQIEPFTRDSLEAYFKGLELRVSARELQLLCVIKKPQDIIFSTFGGKIFTHPNYGYIGMLGSGMNYLQKYLDKQIHLLSADHGLNPAQFGILFALRTSGDLLSREFITQSTLEQFFGAGYVSRNCWKKLSTSVVVVNKKLRRLSTVGSSYP